MLAIATKIMPGIPKADASEIIAAHAVTKRETAVNLIEIGMR